MIKSCYNCIFYDRNPKYYVGGRKIYFRQRNGFLKYYQLFVDLTNQIKYIYDDFLSLFYNDDDVLRKTPPLQYSFGKKPKKCPFYDPVSRIEYLLHKDKFDPIKIGDFLL